MMSSLAELGFTLLISQFVSHEFAELRMSSGYVRGEFRLRDKLFSLIKYAIKIYLIVVPLASVLMIFVGLYVLSEQPLEIRIAWILFALISSLTLIQSLFQSIYQGLDKVAAVYKNRTLGTLLIPGLSWPLMYFGFGIWSLVISTGVALIVMLYFLFRLGIGFWIQLFRHNNKTSYNWNKEIIPLQTKYTISWISGYAAVHLLVPITFKIFGPVAAGQLGIAVSICAGITTLSTSWVDSVTKIKFSSSKKRKKRA